MGDTVSLIHIWWSCPLLAPFWDKVIESITLITETKLVLDAACCLLHISNFTLKKYKHSLTKHLLNAAKSLIPIHWNSPRFLPQRTGFIELQKSMKWKTPWHNLMDRLRGSIRYGNPGPSSNTPRLLRPLQLNKLPALRLVDQRVDGCRLVRNH